MFPYVLNDRFSLRVLEAQHAPVFFDTIQQNKAHLDPWLRWSGWLKTIEDVQQYIDRFTQKWAAGDGFHAGIWEGERLVGGSVCHYINHESRRSEVGYWLVAEAVGHGLASHATQAVLKYLFEDQRLHRVEIRCAVDNVRSRAIPERLGFALEGIARESEWLTDHFADHAMYAILEQEWFSASK